jgi:lambda repressor-like predicted transcriptional regulator
MVNAIGSLDLRPDPLRRALYRAYLKIPRAIKVALGMWSNDITYGRLIDAAEKAGDRKKLRNLLGVR